MQANYSDSVFINCPFDSQYNPIFRAIVFTVYRCGFLPVCALDEDNGLDNRLRKIEKQIQSCQYGIHDLSRAEQNSTAFPRFNMPFELGIFWGAKKFGNQRQRSKNALRTDSVGPSNLGVPAILSPDHNIWYGDESGDSSHNTLIPQDS